jgi:hypothetical protein
VSAPVVPGDAFGSSRELFERAVDWLDGAEAAGLEHAELETQLDTRGRDLLRQLYQDHTDLRAQREPRLAGVTGVDGVTRSRVETGHARALTTVFGEVTVARMAYRASGQTNLHPADAAWNLPTEKHSHGLRRLAAIEATRGSFDDAADAIDRGTGVAVGKRQVEQLAVAAAADFDDFYDQRQPPTPDTGDGGEVLVVSVDGRGIVMRRDALRPATAKAAAATAPKLAARLSKGEKRNRKRLAEVGAVYHVTPVPRTAADILPTEQHDTPRRAPTADDKWLTASVAADAATVIASVFDEAERRDPNHEHTWIALVDGNTHQIERIHAEADARGVTVTTVIDFIHVLEYLWKAAWCFFTEADPAAEAWVRDKATAVLDGNARAVATGIRRRATTAGLTRGTRKNADDAANYLTAKATHLDYPTALASGWPIATGVIEGACRHLVKDRMDITGARWGLAGAEAILKLRALHSNDDFDDYWRYHLDRERHRVHEIRYLNDTIPRAA